MGLEVLASTRFIMVGGILFRQNGMVLLQNPDLVKYDNRRYHNTYMNIERDTRNQHGKS